MSSTIVKNKYLTKKILIDAGIDDTPQVYLVKDGESVDDLKQVLHYPVIVKPCDGSGSRGITKVQNQEKLDAAVNLAILNSLSKSACILSFIEGKEYGIESIVINGKVTVLGVMKKLMTKPPYYAELGHAIPSLLSEERENKIKECAVKAIRAIGINSGSVNMDVILTDGGKVYIIDMGARMGGNLIGSHIIPYGTGYDYMSSMIRVAAGDDPNLIQHEHSAVATRLLAFKKGHISKVPDIEKIEKEFDVEIYHHMTDDMDVNEYHINRDGLGYIVARAVSYERATAKAKKAYEYLESILF